MTDTRKETEDNAEAFQPGGADIRSENLLPAGQAPQDDDGRFEVAEEVNLDEQSDATRRVGKLPAGSTSDALAEVYRDEDKKG